MPAPLSVVPVEFKAMLMQLATASLTFRKVCTYLAGVITPFIMADYCPARRDALATLIKGYEWTLLLALLAISLWGSARNARKQCNGGNDDVPPTEPPVEPPVAPLGE